MALYGTILVLLILDLIPGVVCNYDYNIGGLVAAVLVGIFCLIGVIVMIIIAVLWHDWYERRQNKRGIYRVPRDDSSYRGIFRKKTYISSNAASTPRSERNGTKRMYNMPGSHHTTVNQEINADTWMGHLNGGNTFEEKGQSITFDAEEEPVIVADVLPDTNNMYSRTQRLDATHTRQGDYVITRSTQNEAALLTTDTSYQSHPSHQSEQPVMDEHTTYVAIGSTQRGASPQPMQQMRHTMGNVIHRDPIHVQSGKLSQTTRPGTGQSGIVITPLIPDGTDAQNTLNSTDADVVHFDSDDEAGFTPSNYVRQNDVLF